MRNRSVSPHPKMLAATLSFPDFSLWENWPNKRERKKKNVQHTVKQKVKALENRREKTST